MTKSEPIIAVKDVPKSSVWYQQLLDCKGSHGGDVFEILVNEEDEQILSLHLWGEHDHPTFTDPTIPIGNGLILYFVVDDLDKSWLASQELNATVEEAPHINNNSGRMEFSLRDLDGYYISICSDNN